MNTIKIDRTIKPGDLVECQRWGFTSTASGSYDSSIAMVVEVESAEVFSEKDSIVHLLFTGSNTRALAMLSACSRINPVSS